MSKMPLQPLKRDAKLETWYVKGVPFANKNKTESKAGDTAKGWFISDQYFGSEEG